LSDNEHSDNVAAASESSNILNVVNRVNPPSPEKSDHSEYCIDAAGINAGKTDDLSDDAGDTNDHIIVDEVCHDINDSIGDKEGSKKKDDTYVEQFPVYSLSTVGSVEDTIFTSNSSVSDVPLGTPDTPDMSHDSDADAEKCEQKLQPEIDICEFERSVRDIGSLKEDLTSLKSDLTDWQHNIGMQLEASNNSISKIDRKLEDRTDVLELKGLKTEFETFSKRLKRVAKEEDVLGTKSIDASKVPSEVLEITYAQTLNDMVAAIFDIYGDNELNDIVENVRDQVREISAGIDFFDFDNGIFTIDNLSEAIGSKLISVKQVHGTYIELFNKLSEYAPAYDSRDFRSFVESGSREYSVEKLFLYGKRLKNLESRLNDVEIGFYDISGAFRSLSDNQTQQSEQVNEHSEGIKDVMDHIKRFTKAINVHTSSLKVLNNKFEALQSMLEGGATPLDHPSDAGVPSNIEELMDSKAERSDLDNIYQALDAFKNEIFTMLEPMQKQHDETLSRGDVVDDIQEDLSAIKDETTSLTENPSLNDESIPLELSENSMSMAETVYEMLKQLGPITLKKLETQLDSDGYSVDMNDLQGIIERLEMGDAISSQRKGRYIYYSVEGQDLN